MMRHFAIIAGLLLISACGKEVDLKPAAGKSMPQKPAMAREVPTTEQLLTPGPEARPERNTEQVRRSEQRKEDPFDLPPPSN